MSNLPKGWSLVELNEICNINMGQSPKSESYNENNIGLPLIQGNADIKNRKTLPRTYTSDITKKCKIGDIIMTVRAPVGAIAKSYHNACIGRGVCSITPKENNDFLYHFLVGYEDKWDKLSQGSTFTAVNGNDIKKIKLPLPPLEEQKKIADILSTVDKKIAFVEENINVTEELKKGLMQKLLTEGIGHTEFKDSELGRIPQGWELKTLGELVFILTDYTANGSFASLKENVTYFNEPNFAALVRTTDLKKKEFKPERFTDKRGYEFLKKSALYGGEILMANVGSIGEVYIVPEVDFPMTLAPNMYLIKYNDNLINTYAYYFMNSSIFINQLLSKIASTTLQAVNKANFKSIKIPLPPLEEQKKIADILSTVDKKLENLKEKKQSFEELKKGLMQKLLTGEVRV